MAIEKIDLSNYVPETAIEVSFKWQLKPIEGRVKLYRTPTDPNPYLLNGPSGAGLTDITEPQILYYEKSSGTKNLEFLVTGYRDDLSR